MVLVPRGAKQDQDLIIGRIAHLLMSNSHTHIIFADEFALLFQWDNNMLGWHSDSMHEIWTTHGEQVLPGLFSKDGDEVCTAAPKSVFVSLCGKTVDMAHLAASPAVEKLVGVDGILKALETFAAEHPQLEIKPSSAVSDGKYDRLVGNKIELLRGDFFGLDEHVTGGRFDVIFDRASLIAIDPSLRESYVETMGKLLKPGGQILLITLTRPDDAGPPFNTPETVVRQLYEGKPWVKSVEFLGASEPEVKEDGGVWNNISFLIKGK